MQTQRHVATNLLRPSQLTECESAYCLLPSTPVIAIYYYYSPRKLILILPSRGRSKADINHHHHHHHHRLFCSQEVSNDNGAHQRFHVALSFKCEDHSAATNNKMTLR